MENTSYVFYLAKFEAPYAAQVFILSLCLVMYLTVTAANLLVLVTVLVTTSLHKPMHIFLCNLVISDVFISTAGMPKQVHVLLTGDREILRISCFAQMFILHTSALNEIFTLAIMSVDRYLAICYPLHYHTKVTAKRSIFMSLLSWLVLMLSVGVQVTLISSITFSEKNRQIQGIICDNMGISKLAVGDTSKLDAYSASKAAFTLSLAMSVIAYTYVRIVIECQKTSSSAFRSKALHTFGTHFMALAIFFTSILGDILLLRFVRDADSAGVRNMRSAIQLVFLLSPVANVLIYCLRTTELRLAIQKQVKIMGKVYFCSRIKIHALVCG